MCVYMLGSPTGMTWSSGNSRDAIAADTLFFFSLYVGSMIDYRMVFNGPLDI